MPAPSRPDADPTQGEEQLQDNLHSVAAGGAERGPFFRARTRGRDSERSTGWQAQARDMPSLVHWGSGKPCRPFGNDLNLIRL